jgi:hypothetical protein
MIKLLESINTDENQVAQNPDDGAALNFLASYKKNGRVWGAAVSWSGKVFTIAKGLLIARGYRIQIDSSTTLLDLTSAAMPSSQTVYSVLITITRTGHNATFAVSYQAASLTYPTAAIDQVEGSFSLKIGTLTLSTSGVVGYTDVLSTIAPSSGGGSSSGIGATLPAPVLEIVSPRKGGAYSGWLALKNKGDYNGYLSSYTVRLILYRYLGKGKFRERSGSTKVYLLKSSWVEPASSLGWGSTKVAKVTDLTALKTVTVASNGTLTYVRKDIIGTMADYANAVFYDLTSAGAKTAVTSASDVYAIRATRSKKEKTATQYGHHHKHNFFIFAYRIRILSGATVVASSPMSNAVVITPNLRIAPARGTTGGIQDKFRFKVE